MKFFVFFLKEQVKWIIALVVFDLKIRNFLFNIFAADSRKDNSVCLKKPVII